MRSDVLRRALELPWGDPPGLPESFAEPPVGGIAFRRPPSLVRAPVRLRVASSHLELLAADSRLGGDGPPTVARFSDAGEELWRCPLAPPEPRPQQWRIVDFAGADGATVVVLDDVVAGGERHLVLRRLAADGSEIWRRRGRPGASLDLGRLEGDFHQLLSDGSSVYLPATRHRGLVARIDLATGRLEPHVDWGEWTGEAFLAPGGALCFVRMETAPRRRAWCRLDPASGKETREVLGQEASRWLSVPLGVDAEGRVYALDCMRVARIDPGRDAVEWLPALEGIAPGPQHQGFSSSHQRADTLEIDTWSAAGHRQGRTVLELPAAGGEAAGPARLIGRDRQGRLLVTRGDSLSGGEALLIFSAAGQLESVAVPPRRPDRHEHRLQGAMTWRVAPAGGVYLPLLAPTAFLLLLCQGP